MKVNTVFLIILFLFVARIGATQHQEHQHTPEPLPQKEQPEQKEIYTCPMHPEVQSDKPGTCPKCGMTLVPVTAKEEAVTQDFKEGLTLEQLEQMALESNPTIAQAVATVKGAEGRKQQAGLYPNPIVGVEVDELSQRDPEGRNERHIFFNAEQTILLGGKRGKARAVFEGEKKRAEQELEIQKSKVVNTVRILYYQLLGAQHQLQARLQLQKIAEEASQITGELFNTGAADRPDLLESEVETHTAEIAALTAENEREHLWRQLAAVIGKPEMPLTQVAGSLETSLPDLNREILLESLLNNSLQVKAAELELQRSRSEIEFAKSQRIPDLTLFGGVGYNYEKLQSTGKAVGVEGFFGVGIPLPLFNRNQGNIAIAAAEAERDEQDLKRIKLALTAQFSTVYADYLNTKSTAQKYRDQVLPKAREAYELYLNSFRGMAAAYPQVLIAQRNRYQLEVEYIEALAKLWSSALNLQGFLLSEGALDAPPFRFTPELEVATESTVLRRETEGAARQAPGGGEQ